MISAKTVKKIREKTHLGMLESKNLAKLLQEDVKDDLRVRFTGLAMQGILSNDEGEGFIKRHRSELADLSVKIADALIERLEMSEEEDDEE